MQQARALQQSEAFGEYRQRRVVVEHRLARLVQLGIRQSRYFGRVKTRCQLYLAATVANLTLVAAKAGLTGKTGSGPSASSAQVAGMVNSAANAATAWLGQIRTLTLLVSAPCRSRSSFRTTNASPRFEFDDEGTESTGLLSRLPLIVLDRWARSGAGRCVTGLATIG